MRIRNGFCRRYPDSLYRLEVVQVSQFPFSWNLCLVHRMVENSDTSVSALGQYARYFPSIAAGIFAGGSAGKVGGKTGVPSDAGPDRAGVRPAGDKATVHRCFPRFSMYVGKLIGNMEAGRSDSRITSPGNRDAAQNILCTIFMNFTLI